MSSSIQKPGTNKQKKLLKSCIRCRKHKTKCDSYLKSPGPCSNCLKKNHVCKIEFISPPKRFDNLKNLNNNLVDIHAKINDMLQFYESMRVKLNISELKSYQEFKAEHYPGFHNTDNSDFNSDYNSDYDDNDDMTAPALNIHDSCLLKLSNSKFVNISVDSSLIKINGFEHNISETSVLIGQHYLNLFNLFQILALSYNPCDSKLVMNDEDLLGPLEAFKENKLLFAIAAINTNHNDSELQLINQFLKDYLDSYYKIIQKEKLNSDQLNSTPNDICSTADPTENLVFGKFELCNFLNLKFFNNDRFLIKLIKTLIVKFFINLNDVDDSKFLIVRLVKIIELKLNLNRKNFNFEKNLSTNWKLALRFIIDYYYSSSFNIHLFEDFKIHQFKEEENLQNLLNNYKIDKKQIFQNLNKLSFVCQDLTNYLNSDSKISTSSSTPTSESSSRSTSSACSLETNVTVEESPDIAIEQSAQPSQSVEIDLNHLQEYLSQQTKLDRAPSTTQKTSVDQVESKDGKKSDADYEVILDNLIDWQKDSTDDVLMKINQLIKN